ncbi:MAG: ABC transporter ATP-binding protein [Clostridia bacterium]|nr:ABC transporter ATP-binding protein [Clostridia bacterium]
MDIKQPETEKPPRNKRIANGEDYIPNYDHLFGDESTEKKGTKGLLRKLLKVNLGGFIVSTVVYFFMALPLWVTPLCTANIINEATDAVQNGMTDEILMRLALNIGAILFCLALNVPTTVWRWRIVSRMLRRTGAGIKSAVIRKLQGLSITYHRDMQSGKIQAKFLRDVDSVDGLLSSVIQSLVPNIVTVLVSTAISVYKNGFVALFFLLVIPCNVWLGFAFRKKIRDTNKDLRVKTEDMSAKLTTMMEMTSVTKSHGLQEVEIKNLDTSIKNVMRSGLAVDKVTAYFGSMSFVVHSLLNIGCLVFCVFLAVNKVISVGEIVLYQSMFSSISGQISAIIGIMPQLGRGMDALSSVAEIMNATDVEHSIGNVRINRLKGDVEFRHVSYAYPDNNTYVVKDFNLEVKSGQCVAFVGSSGSGKSTLMNILIGLLVPQGEVLIDGKPMSELDLAAYRHRISVVPQNSILFPGTIRENITYGLDSYSEEQLEKVVEMANMNEFLKDLPLGLDTPVGEHGDKLSGGQKQRVTIARALIRNPDILILDEATSALDNISEYHVQQAIAASVVGRTTFIVAHRLSTIRNADIIVVMEEGVCVEKGSYEELMNKKGKFYELKNLNDLNSKIAEAALGGGDTA